MYYTEAPDKWVILKITNKGESVYKLLAGWYGGYAGSDEWRISSGIVSYEEVNDCVYFTNTSGSVYRCSLGSEGTTGYTQSKLDYLKSQQTDDLKIETIMLKNYK